MSWVDFIDQAATNATVVDEMPAPSDGGLPESTTPADLEEFGKINQAVLANRKRQFDILDYFHSGNTAQRAMGEQSDFPNFKTIAGIRKQAVEGNITGRDYLEMTGRINAGIGTGDTATKDAQGNITGYERNRSAFTPDAQWNTKFSNGGTNPDYVGMAKPPKANIKSSVPANGVKLVQNPTSAIPRIPFGAIGGGNVSSIEFNTPYGKAGATYAQPQPTAYAYTL